jgi:hypothetical protein
MKSILAIALFWTTMAIVFAQGNHVRVEVSSDVDTSDADIAQIIRLMENYLNSNPDSVYQNPYWVESEQRLYRPFDLVAHTGGRSLYEELSQYRIIVFGISMIDEAYIAETAFFRLQGSDPWQFNLTRVVLTGASQDEGRYKLCNALFINTLRWRREEVGSIKFVFPPDQLFDRAIAERMNRFVDSLTTLWQIQTLPITYYFADDFNTVKMAFGIKYQIPYDLQRPRMVIDSSNRFVYSEGLADWDPHELVRIYLSSLFPDANDYFREGYATFVGGYGGHDFSWHIKGLCESLKRNQELDLFAFLDLSTTMGAKRFIGGLLCKEAEVQGGLDAIRTLMTYGSGDEDFYRAIRDVFGISSNKLDEFLKAKLVEFATR